MNDWYVGQKIVCISLEYDGYTIGGKPFKYTWHNTLKKGMIYTIEQINTPKNPNNTIGLCLYEITRSHGKRKRGFPSTMFRPLLTKQTDISIFTELLNKDYSKLELIE